MDNKKIKAIEILDDNCRTPIKDIAKRLRVSKQRTYAILEELEKKEIVGYLTVINYFNLGFENMHVYLKIQGLNRIELDSNLKKIEKIKNITWVSDFLGEYDIGVSIFYKSMQELNSTLNRIYDILGGKIKKRELFPIIKQIIPSLSKTKNYVLERTDNVQNLCSEELNLLKILESNGRFNYFDIAQKMECSRITIKKKIDRFYNQKIIVGFKPLFNYNALGKIWHLCILKIIPGEDSSEIVEIIKAKENVPFVSLALENQIIFDFTSNEYNELKEFLNYLKARYDKKIDDYCILNVNKNYKLIDIPS
jgi:DNA-binding Lrp family transcriptional regulator